MGYDLYGLNPSNPNNAVRPEHLDWGKEYTEQEKKKYFKAVDKYETEVVGSYFRANVWWWRPIWTFVCYSCDFLSAKDCDKGGHNGGETISKTKSLRIASRLRKLDRTGVIDAWVDEYMTGYKKAKKDNEKVQKKIDKLQDKVKNKLGDSIVPADYPEPYKTKWNNLYSERSWSSSYPTNKDIIMQFADFCEQSGGFEIC